MILANTGVYMAFHGHQVPFPLLVWALLGAFLVGVFAGRAL